MKCNNRTMSLAKINFWLWNLLWIKSFWYFAMSIVPEETKIGSAAISLAAHRSSSTSRGDINEFKFWRYIRSLVFLMAKIRLYISVWCSIMIEKRKKFWAENCKSFEWLWKISDKSLWWFRCDDWLVVVALVTLFDSPTRRLFLSPPPSRQHLCRSRSTDVCVERFGPSQGEHGGGGESQRQWILDTIRFI